MRTILKNSKLSMHIMKKPLPNKELEKLIETSSDETTVKLAKTLLNERGCKGFREGSNKSKKTKSELLEEWSEVVKSKPHGNRKHPYKRKKRR